MEAAGGYGERRWRGGSRAKNEDDGWEKNTRRYILGQSLVPAEATPETKGPLVPGDGKN